jgi:D-tyrosyl-tRNA(Tyr) deacylase
MRALLQRVSSASVRVDEKMVGEIDRGLLIYLGVQRGDTAATGDKLFDKIVNYRMFSDASGKMNLSVNDVNGGLLIVSQFTLAAETGKGRRPGFSSAAEPDLAKKLYDYCIAQAQRLTAVTSDRPISHASSQMLKARVAAGVFGADMQVSLTNDGPVTFMLEVKPDL